LANIKSAEKRNRQSLKRRARNTSVRTEVKAAVKKAREAVANKDAQGVVEAVKLATKSLAKAGSKGVLHPRTASRRIGRLAKAAHAAKAAK